MNAHALQEDLFDPQIIPASLAITAMRDSGYKSTAYALAELIDNAQQAKATVIELLCLEKREHIKIRSRSRLSEVAVLDNGEGMDHRTLRLALQFGNGKYLKDRSGIGRFGMGLPNASISQARKVEVWTWQNGLDNALYSYLDVVEIESGRLKEIPDPQHKQLPKKWRKLSNNISKSGTLVVWSDLELHRLTWKGGKATLENTERVVGRIYRRFIQDGSIRIRLFAKGEGDEVIYDKEAAFDDPLFLAPSPIVPKPFDKEPMFEHLYDQDHLIEYEGKVHKVKVRFSIAKKKTIELVPEGRSRGDEAYGKHAANHIGVSVMRAGRELMLDPGWCNSYDPRERWWGAEVEFPPALDEVFGVTNNKQAATHLSEIAKVDHKQLFEQLREDKEEPYETVKRLQREGDPRGHLLELHKSILRNLGQLREKIKDQGKKSRSTHKKRHGTDPATEAANKGWKGRSKEKKLEGEDSPRTDEQLREIKRDLLAKQYPESDADALIKLIFHADLRIVFLEADFQNPYQLFNVEIKGNLTEVTFNRKHPAFDCIFGTLNTVDEDVREISHEEILSRLMRAINASKIIFAAWARFEREASLEKAKALERVRYGWGQIAAGFLASGDDLSALD